MTTRNKMTRKRKIRKGRMVIILKMDDLFIASLSYALSLYCPLSQPK
jgi:hypothetical protein